jgi:hypothetical protein
MPHLQVDDRIGLTREDAGCLTPSHRGPGRPGRLDSETWAGAAAAAGLLVTSPGPDSDARARAGGSDNFDGGRTVTGSIKGSSE